MSLFRDPASRAKDRSKDLTSPPTYASYPSEKLTIGAGVAIFHLATARVVICYHTRDKYYFLPKGRKNANEVVTAAAEREGFEESGYRNRMLPLPFKHRQTQPDGEERHDFVTEAMWMQLLPLTSTAQYLLFWHAAETVPREVEEEYTAAQTDIADPKARLYKPPPAWPKDLTVKQRIAMDTVKNTDGTEKACEPVYHEGTGVDEEEACYRSFLLPIEEAKRRLRNEVMCDLIDRIWAAVQLRITMEQES